MSLGTYSELKTAIGGWRFDEGTVLAPLADNFIDLAEDRINNGDRDGPYPTPQLRCREMETTASLTLTGGAANLPAGFLEALRVSAGGTLLTYATPDWYEQAYPQNDSSRFYTIIGSQLLSGPSSPVEFVYYTAVPALSESSASNWLLTKAPRVYLYGTGLEASVFRGDLARAEEMAALFRGALSGLQASDSVSRAGRFERRASAVAW